MRPWPWQGEPGGVGLWRVAALEAAGARAVFSSRLGGVSAPPFGTLNLGAAVGDDAQAVVHNRLRFATAAGFDAASVARLDQVHGRDVIAATTPGLAGRADALITDVPDLVLAIGVADCAAIYLLDPLRRACALCHAGWRGTVADVVGRAVAELQRRHGCRPADLLAAVAPCAGACCYQVDEPVIQGLTATASWAGEVLRPDGPGRARLDLAEANRRRLLDAGLHTRHIHLCGICTICDPVRLFSHRRDGVTGRMHAALWLPAGAVRSGSGTRPTA